MPRRVTQPDEYRQLRMTLQLDPDAQPRLAHRLRELRMEHGLTLSELAEFCGLSGKGAYVAWEKEPDGTTPDIPMLLLLADFYGVSMDYLIGVINVPRDNQRLQRAKQALQARLPSLDVVGLTVGQRIELVWRVAQEVDPAAFPQRRVGGLIGGLDPDVFTTLVSGRIPTPSDVVISRFSWALGIPEQFLHSGLRT